MPNFEARFGHSTRALSDSGFNVQAMGALPAATLAAKGSAWGGMVIGLVAAGVFIVFSTYILAQRFRSGRKDRTDD